MKRNNDSKLFWFLTVLPLIITIGYFSFLPDQIPAHYGVNGEVDRWGSKWEVFILPFVAIFLCSLLKLWMGKLIQNEKYKANANALDKMLIGMPIIFLVLTIMFSITALKSIENLDAFPFYKILVIATGFVFALTGNYLPKLKSNPLIGIRTKWTLQNEEVWRKTHLFGGIVWAVGGIAISFVALLFSNDNSMYVLFVGIMILVVVPFMYSYFCFKKLNS